MMYFYTAIGAPFCKKQTVHAIQIQQVPVRHLRQGGLTLIYLQIRQYL